LRIAVTESFRRCYEKLLAEIQAKVDRQLDKLSNDLRHPSLRVKKIKGTLDVWEARVDRCYRLTFSVREDVLYLRRVGPHDPTLNRP